MASEACPSSFLIDFMKRSDIVRLVREAESNSALYSRLDILVSIWQLTKVANSRGAQVMRRGVESVYNLAVSSVNLEDVGGEWKRWQKKRAHILADAEKNAHAVRGTKTGYRVQEKSHIDDVTRFEAAFGIEDAVIFANLTDIQSWYAWPKPRKALMLYHLDREYDQSRISTTIPDSKRAADHLADDWEETMEERAAKRVWQGTKTSIEQRSIRISEVESNSNTKSLTGSIVLQHPVVQPTWTGVGKSFLPIYDGQFSISGSTDRCIHYRWSAISAYETLLTSESLPTSSDVQWLYYHVNRSKIQKLPFATLSQIIQRSEHWIEEGNQGLTVSACLRLAFSRSLAEEHGAYCRISCIVPGLDAPELN